MSFEYSTIELSNERKSKKDFKEFLAEQISLPKDQWNEEFKKYIEGKIKENKLLTTDAGVELTAAEQQKEDFDRYLKGLDVTIDDLKDKTILDLGSGEGSFVKECIDKNITENVYGLDIEIPEMVEEKYRRHFLQDDFEKPLPMKNVDYIISVGAVSGFMWQKGYEHAKEIIKNYIRALNEKKAEIRMYPIQKPSKEGDLEGLVESYQQWNKLLSEISREDDVRCELLPIDIRVSGKNNNVWLDQVLVIKKTDKIDFKY